MITRKQSSAQVLRRRRGALARLATKPETEQERSVLVEKTSNMWRPKYKRG